MQSLEFEAKTIDEAIEKACTELDVTRDKLNIEILNEGSSGFLGILGNKRAKIRATLLSFEETLKDSSSATESDAKDNDQCLPYSATDDNPTAQAAKTLLEGILARMNLTCPVTVEEADDRIVLDIKSNGGGLVIGRRGQNLDALQYIVNKAIHKSAHDRKMIIVDTESYRQRREESLNALAAKVGERVKKTRKAVTLNYLNAHNRRIIHMALQNDAGITTKSRGEGEFRKLIIVPSNKD